MKWVSSRGNSPAVPFIDALFAGTAPDGGLYMPERLEPLSGVKAYPIRVKCATLPWRAFEAALKSGALGETVKTE